MIAADQMIRNLSMKIGEVDSGSARLLAAHSNLAEPKSTSPIFMLEISYHLVAAVGGENRHLKTYSFLPILVCTCRTQLTGIRVSKRDRSVAHDRRS